MNPSFKLLYPNTAYFVNEIGLMEMGRAPDSPLTSFIRAIDLGGLVWDAQDGYPTSDEAFADLEQGLTIWMQEQGLSPSLEG